MQTDFQEHDHLSERRKADRVKMAKILADLVTECGAETEVQVRPYETMMPQLIRVGIKAARGLRLGVDFDGKSCQHDIYVNAWNISTKFDTCLSSAFPGDVNPFHFSKCTTVEYGFAALCRHVRQVLEMARDGSAFDAEREAAQIKKAGSTAAERQARWAVWRVEFEKECDAKRAAESAHG
jgi:hypothetical protein